MQRVGRSVDPEFDFGSGHTENLRKLVSTVSCLAIIIKDRVKKKPASSLVVTLRKALNGAPTSCVEEKVVATINWNTIKTKQ